MAQKGGYWVPADIKDEEIKYSFDPHRPTKLSKTIPWLWCPKCGLLYLKNPITKWCIKMGCDHHYRPQYEHMLKKLTSRRRD